MNFRTALVLMQNRKKIRRPSWEKTEKNVHYICLNEFGNIVDEKGFSPSINVKRIDYEVY